MYLVSRRFQHLPVRHAQLRFASNASLGTTAALIAAAATGLANLVFYVRLSASAAGSIGFTNGSGGTNFMNFHLAAANAAQEAPWWDPAAQSGGTPVYAVSQDGIGSGEIDVWYITVRRGAGEGATIQ